VQVCAFCAVTARDVVSWFTILGDLLVAMRLEGHHASSEKPINRSRNPQINSDVVNAMKSSAASRMAERPYQAELC
jgi:hypothetical protein